MNKDKVYLKGYVIGRAADTLGYQGLMVQLENLDIVEIDEEVLVYNPSTQKIYTDIWVDYGEGIGFENTDEDTVFWISYPKPPKEMEE